VPVDVSLQGATADDERVLKAPLKQCLGGASCDLKSLITHGLAIDDQIPLEMRRNGAMGAPRPSWRRIARPLVLILVTVVAGR